MAGGGGGEKGEMDREEGVITLGFWGCMAGLGAFEGKYPGYILYMV